MNSVNQKGHPTDALFFYVEFRFQILNPTVSKTLPVLFLIVAPE